MDRQIEELLPFYALDALTEEERERVEAYLKEHPEARLEVESMAETVAELPYSVTPVEPSPRTKEALLRRVAADQARASSARNQPVRARGIRGENILRTFTLGIATLAVVWVMILNAQVMRLRNEISALNDALATQSNSIDQIVAQLPRLASSAAVTVSLQGTDIQPQAQGQLIADPNSRSAVLVIGGLPPLEVGKTYQVWLIDGGGPASAGLLTVDPNGQGLLIVTSEAEIGSFDSLGISIEPDGGSPQPTGEIVVLSEL